MSTTIDNKVVSMEFQNDRFEKNIAQTQSSIERLKKSLKFNGASKGFEELQKSAEKVDLNTITNSIDNINSRFNVMTYAAAAAVANITDRFVNMGINIGKSLSIDQLAAGWDKYNEKTANVQTIMNATGKSVEEVNDILGELQWFSDETSYSFTQMTKAFADMTSKGGEADKVKDMVMGIAEATAFAGKTGNEFSRVIYNLSQAYGSKLLVKDWMSIENAGVNSKQLIETLIAAGEAEGTINKGAVSVATFRESLSKGWVTSEVMERGFSGWAAMMKEAYRLVNDEHAFDNAGEAIASLEGKYDDYVEKATKAAQSAKSFSEVLDATKDAVSSQWSRIWEAIFGNYEQATELWSEVVDGMWTAFAEPMSNAADYIEAVMGSTSAYGDFAEQLSKAGIKGEVFRKELVKIAVETGALDQATVDAEESIDALFNGEKGSWLTNNIIVTALKKFRGEMDSVSTATNAVTMSFEELEDVAKRVIRGEFGVGVTRMEQLEKAGYKAAAVQDIVNKMMRGQAINAEDYADALVHLTDEQGNNIELTEEQIAELDKLIKETDDVEGAYKALAESMTKPTGRELLIDSFRLLIQNTMAILDRFKESYRTIFPKKGISATYNAIESFHSFAESLVLSEESLDKLTRTFNGLFASIDIVLKIVSIPLRFALKVLDVVLRAFGVTTLDVAANVGDAIVAFREWLLETGPLAKAFENTAEFVGNLIIKIKDLWSWFRDLPIVTKTVEFFGKVWDKIVSIFKELQSRIDTFRKSLKDLKGKDALSLKNIWGAFKTDILHDFKEISDWFDKFKESGSKVADAFSTAFNSAKIKTGGFLSKLKEFGSSMIDSIFGEDAWGAAEVVAILSGVAVAKLTSAFAKAIDSFDGLSGALKGVLNSVSGMFSQFGKVLKSFKYQVWTIGLLNIAKAILFLAGAVFLLAKIPAEDLDRAIDGIGTIITMFAQLTLVIAGLSILVNKFGGGGFLQIGNKVTGKSGGFFALAMTVTAMALALLSLAGAFKLISDINPDALWRSVEVMTVMVAVLTTFATLANVYSKGMSGGAITILAMGVAMKSMAKAMKELADLVARDDVNWGKLYLTLISIEFILMSFTAIIGAFGKRLDWKASLTVVAIAVAFKIIVGALDDISDLDGDKIRQNADIVLTAVGILIAVMAATILLGKNVEKAGRGIIGIVAGLALLVIVVKMTQDMEPEQAWHTLEVLKPLLIAIGALMLATLVTGKYAARAAALIAATGFSMILIAVAIKALASMSESDIQKATRYLGLIELLLSALLVATKDITTSKVKTTSESKAGPIIAVGIVVAILAILLYLLTKYADLDKFDAAVKSLSILMASLGALLFAVSKLDKVEVKLSTLLSMVLILALLGGIIAGLSWILNGDVKPTQLIAATASIGILALVMLGITLALKKFSQMKISTNWETAIKRLVPALLVIVILAGLIALVSHAMNTEVRPSQMLALGVTVAILAGVVVAITLALNSISKSKSKTNIGKTLVVVLEGLIAFAAIIAALYLIQYALDSIYGPDLIAKTEQLVVLADLLGQAIGAFLGNIAEQLINGIIRGLTNFGACIEAFGESIDKSGIDENKIKLLIGLAGAIALLTGAELVDGLVNLLDSIPGLDFGFDTDDFKELGEMVSAFNDATKDISAARAATLGIIAKAAANVAKAVQSIGDTSAITNLESFPDAATHLGEGLVNFGIAVKDVDVESVQHGVDAGNLISDFQKGLYGSGGIVQAICGEKDLGVFGSNMGALASGLVDFSKTVVDADSTNVENGVNLANQIAGINIKSMGGVVSWFAGRDDIGTFGDKLSELADGLKDFIDKVKGYKTTSLTKALSAVDLVDKLSKVNIDPQNLDSFDTAIFGSYGSMVSNFNEPVKNITADRATALGKIVATAGAIAKTIGSISGISTISNMDSFPEAGKKLAEGMVNFGKSSESIDLNNVQKGVDAISLISEIQKVINSQGGLLEAVYGKKDLSSFGQNMIDLANGIVTFAETVSGVDPEKVQLGVDLANKVSNIDVVSSDMFTNITEKITGYCDSLIETMSTYYDDMETAGKEFINSFFEGALGETDANGVSQFAKNISDLLVNKIHDATLSMVSGTNVAMAAISGASFSGNVNLDVSQLNGSLKLINDKLNGTLKIDMHEITTALTDIKDLMTTQNDILSKISTAINLGGKVYIDGNILAGYIDKKLGTITS